MSFYQPVAPAGVDGQVQLNKGKGFGASPDFTWDDTSTPKVLTVGGDINLDDGTANQTTLQLVTPTEARTITFPDATGTVGLVAGSTGQLVFNLDGAYSGLSGVTTDGTDVTLTGRFISSLNGAASAPPGTFTGTWFTGGTATTTKPQVLIEPTGTTSTAWSTSGTGLGVNAPSGFGGRLLDLQTNGTSRAVVTGAGQLLVGTSTGRAGRQLQVEGDGLGVYGALTFQKDLAAVPLSTSTELIRAAGFSDNRNQASAYRVTVMATFEGATTRVKEYIWIPQIIQTNASRVLSSELVNVVNNLNASNRALDFTVTASRTGDDEILSITVTSSGALAPSTANVMALVQGIGGRTGFTYPYASAVA